MTPVLHCHDLLDNLIDIVRNLYSCGFHADEDTP